MLAIDFKISNPVSDWTVKVTGVSRLANTGHKPYLLVQRHQSSLPTQPKGIESQPTQTSDFSEIFPSEQPLVTQSILDKDGGRDVFERTLHDYRQNCFELILKSS